jgi:hypothetical protein
LVRRSTVFVLVALIVSVACARGTDPTASPTPTQNTASSAKPGGPWIKIVAPEPGSTVIGDSTTIKAEVRNFKLVDRIGEKNEKGEGHIVYYRLQSRDAEVPVEKGKTTLSGGAGEFTSYFTHKTSYEWPDTPGPFVPQGWYRFVVQLVNNDHTPLSPPQVATIIIRLQSDENAEEDEKDS